MRAFSLLEPWATLVVMGLKPVETRGQRNGPEIRETFAVHASKGKVDPVLAQQVIADAGERYSLFPSAPGCIVGIATCLDIVTANGEGIPDVWARDICKHVGDAARIAALGDFSPGRALYLLGNPQKLHTPVPARGALGMWNVAPQDEIAVMRQL